MEDWPASATVQNWAVFSTPSNIILRRVFWNRIGRALKVPDFWKSITPEILKVWRWSWFLKGSKFYVGLKNAIIILENDFGLEGKCVGTSSRNFCLLWQEYMWSDGNVLKDGPNMSDPTKRHDRKLTFFDINGKLS